MITISYSIDGFETKPQNVGGMRYKEEDVDFTILETLITSGHTLSANFDTKSAIFSQADRRGCNFKSIQFVFFDIDHDCTDELNELIDRMSVKPTVAYTTFSHQKEINGKSENRYRFLFFFDKPIVNIGIYKRIAEQLKYSFPDSVSTFDNCYINPCQAIHGTSTDCIYIFTNKILDLDSYKKDLDLINGQNNSIKKKKESDIQFDCPVTVIDSDFMNDYWKSGISYKMLLDKYSIYYPYFDHTPIPEIDEDIPTITLPDNYVEIKRRTYKEPILDSKGKEKEKYITRIIKLKDGDGRKRKIFTSTLLRKVMMPNVTFPHLLYCGVYDLYYYCYNHEDPITKNQLYRAVYNAARSKPTDGLIAKSKPDKKSIANPAYCGKYGCSKKEAVAQVRHIKKMEKYAEIGNLLDLSLTYVENQTAMKRYGLDVSIKDIQRFRRENNLPQLPRKKRISITSAGMGCVESALLYENLEISNKSVPSIIEILPGAEDRLSRDAEEYLREMGVLSAA